MKKITYKRKLYLDLFSRKKLKQYATCNKRRKRRKIYQKTQKSDEKEYVWNAPNIFNIADSQKRTIFLKSLINLEKAVSHGIKRIVLDFSGLDKMYADATLLFVSELRNIIKHRSNLIFSCIPPNNNKSCQVLKQIKIFDIIKFNNNVIPVDDDVVNWRFAFGDDVDGEKYDNLISNHNGEITESLKTELYNGAVEAMTNVKNHAYIMQRKHSSLQVTNNEWWMFSQQKDGFITIVLCDLGAGIPETIKKTMPHITKILKLLNLRKDSQAIKRTIEEKVSRTQKSYRGNGLAQILKAVDNIKNSSVFIYSNHGVYIRQNNENKIINYKDSVRGTIICWKFPAIIRE